MLVFGPACGFILGSFCTKIYVDAVFIDTSKEALPYVQVQMMGSCANDCVMQMIVIFCRVGIGNSHFLQDKGVWHGFFYCRTVDGQKDLQTFESHKSLHQM